MPTVFLINVGANTAHRAQARSPLFDDGSFEFVPYPYDGCRRPFSPVLHPYVSDPIRLRAHLDPDWQNLTYGDYCHNRRARALLRAKVNDILLFWGLLWKIRDRNANVWDANEKWWCLLGAIRIEAFLVSGQTVEHLTREQQRRVNNNEHMADARVEDRPLVRVFLGDKRHSMRFDRAVDLQIYNNHGLLRQAFRARDGRTIQWESSPRWYSTTRACRAVFDLSDSRSRRQASIVRDRIKELNPGYDLLEDVPLKNETPNCSTK